LGGVLTDPDPTWPQVLAELDGHLREVAELRREIAELRQQAADMSQRVADLAVSRDTWRSRHEGAW
jgi:hypothetical protein